MAAAAAAVVEINNDRFERLKSEGWHLCPVKVLAEIEEFDKLSSKAALEGLKNTDIKNVGIACFPDDASKVLAPFHNGTELNKIGRLQSAIGQLYGRPDADSVVGQRPTLFVFVCS